MRIFTYRNKRAVRKTARILGCILLALALLVIGRVLYVQRYVTYTPDGVRLDYDQHLDYTGQEQLEPDPADYPFETVLDAVAETDGEAEKQTRLDGYSISTTMLVNGVEQVRQALKEVEGYNAVVIDVKSIYGNFYYSTELTGAPKADALDIADVDKLISELTGRSDLIVIARVPAFSDRRYALEHQSEGLPIWNGALWEGDDVCYWLNPYSNSVQGYLTSIAIELSQRGFDGVLFDDFYFPASDRIMWNANITRSEAVLDAAANITDSLYGYGIEVLFGSDSAEVAALGDRVCIRTDAAEDVNSIVEQMSPVLRDPAAQIVFLTSSRDTRFATCGVIRPLIEDSTEG